LTLTPLSQAAHLLQLHLQKQAFVAPWEVMWLEKIVSKDAVDEFELYILERILDRVFDEMKDV